MLFFVSRLERKNNFFEADIVLTQQDVHERGVDTSETGDAKGAKVEVESIGHKRKGIRTRRKIWPSRMIPAAISSGMSEPFCFFCLCSNMKRNIVK